MDIVDSHNSNTTWVELNTDPALWGGLPLCPVDSVCQVLHSHCDAENKLNNRYKYLLLLTRFMRVHTCNSKSQCYKAELSRNEHCEVEWRLYLVDPQSSRPIRAQLTFPLQGKSKSIIRFKYFHTSLQNMRVKHATQITTGWAKLGLRNVWWDTYWSILYP